MQDQTQTKLMKLKLNVRRIAVALVGVAAVTSGAYLIAADHIDAPAVTSKSSDITDFYAFQSPTTSTNMVFVVNTQGLLAPSATGAAAFDSNVMLEINIDNSSSKDAIEDLVLQVTFVGGKVQVYGPVAPVQTGLTSKLVAESNKKVEASISTYGSTPVIGNSNSVQVFAGPRDDPFFFDLNQYKKVIAGTASGFNNPGDDTFKGTNVMSVVIELPKSMLGTGTINTWATSNRKI
jgi:Domain of unknown function (DUF4331)